MVTNNPTHDALLLAVLADPADDACRLIMADWLDEHGGAERAAFVRLQCDPDIRSVGKHVSGAGPAAEEFIRRRRELRRRERELLPGAWADFHAPLHEGGASACRNDDDGPHDEGGGRWGVAWRRGFASKISCPLADWLKHGPGVVRRHPVERVVVTDARRYVEFVGREPGFNGWRDNGLSPIIVPGYHATPEDFASALGEQALTHARRAAFPCRACGGKGRRITIFPMGAPPRECSACGGRGWKVGVTAPTG